MEECYLQNLVDGLLR